jgi:hypothetical protein
MTVGNAVDLNSIETGWKWIDPSDSSHISYSGGWSPWDTTAKGYTIGCIANYQPVYLTFAGTNLRIIGYMPRNYTGNLAIDIDGISNGTFSCYEPSYPSYPILFEKLGLNAGNHTVKLTPYGGGNGYYCIAGFEIGGSAYQKKISYKTIDNKLYGMK